MAKELPQGFRLGNFSIERLLSRNGLQATYAARHSDSSRNSRVSVWSLDPDGEPWQRFRSDLDQLAALASPFIAELLTVGSTPEGLVYAGWAQPDGEDLATRLRRGGAMTLRESLSMARQVASALHAAHRIDVLHRDLTPENIFLCRGDAAAGDYEPVRVFGFGVGRMLEAALAGVAVVGHTEYMAPEQFTGLSFDVGPATDQYALALIVYQSLSASQPFRADSAGAAMLKVMRTTPEHLRALRPDLPSHVDAAVTRALAKDRVARFPDLPAFIAMLIAEEKLPPGLITATDPWLGGSAAMEEALRRAQAAGSAVPSLGTLAHGLAEGAGVPEVVEDSATVPNTMDEVMRLAVPPERAAPAPVAAREPSEPIELEPAEPTPPPSRAAAPSQPGTRRVGGNNLPSRSGETAIPAEPTEPAEPDSVETVIIRGENPVPPRKPAAPSPPSVPTAPPAPPPSSLARLLPPSLAPHAPRIENVLYLVFGLFLGFLVGHFLK